MLPEPESDTQIGSGFISILGLCIDCSEELRTHAWAELVTRLRELSRRSSEPTHNVSVVKGTHRIYKYVYIDFWRLGCAVPEKSSRFMSAQSYSTHSIFTVHILSLISGAQAIVSYLQARRGHSWANALPWSRLTSPPSSKHPFSLFQTLGPINRVILCPSYPETTPFTSVLA